MSGFIIDPDSATTVGVKSTDSGDTGITVTIEGEDSSGNSVSEDISTDGTDATTFVTGSSSFAEIDKITLGSSGTGDIQVYVDDSGSEGTFLAQLPSGTTELEDQEHVPDNAAGDGMIRDQDGMIPNTHTVVRRENRQQGGADDAGLRIFYVMKGSYPETVTITGEPGSEDPVNVTLDYQAEKGRSYKVHQPSSSTEIAFKSTDSSDTSQSITIEDEGAGTSESVSLNGTTLVSTSNTYEDIDALELDAETVGDVEVFINSGTMASPSEGTQLSTIYGSDSYAGSAGDLGVPALGSGSHDSVNPDPTFEEFIGDRIDRPDGTPLAEIIASSEVTVENNLDTIERSSEPTMRIDPGNQDIEITATANGFTQSHDYISEHLRIVQNTLVWEMDGGILYFNNCPITDMGDATVEQGQVRMEIDATFTAQSLDITTKN